MQSIDRHVKASSFSVIMDQEEPLKGAAMTPALESNQHSCISGLDDSDYHDDDEKSIDVFFEDISCSLIDIRKGRRLHDN